MVSQITTTQDGQLKLYSCLVACGCVLSLLMPSSRPRADSQKESSYLQRIAGLCSKSLKVCIEIPYKGLQKAPKSTPVCHSHIIYQWIIWPKGQSSSVAVWTCFRAFSCSRPCSKPAASQSHGKRASVRHPNEEQVASKMLRSTVPPFVGRVRCNNLPFTIEEMLQ